MEYKQISMMSYTIARGEWKKNKDIVELCRFTKELGLDAIDWITTYDTEPKEVRRICDDFGIKTICYTFFTDINFPDKKSRQPGLNNIEKGIEIALILGTDKIMLPLTGKPGLTRDESRRNCIEGLKDAILIAQKYNVAITLEHFPQHTAPFIISSDMDEAIKEIPDLKITYDPGNMVTGGEDPVEGYTKSKNYIAHTHFKDWVLDDVNGRIGADGKHYKAALTGEGILDYPAIVKIMSEDNYKGYINFEYEGSEYTPEEAMIKGVKYLKNLFETIK
ncbi:sugar phosphate isomerase/epimerase [bacterium]|nr:sugar phosphate isomerase/epimerase [bacterium]